MQHQHVSRTAFVAIMMKRFSFNLMDFQQLVKDVESLFNNMNAVKTQLTKLGVNTELPPDKHIIEFKLTATYGKRFFKFFVNVNHVLDTIQEIEVKELTKGEFKTLSKQLNKDKK